MPTISHDQRRAITSHDGRIHSPDTGWDSLDARNADRDGREKPWHVASTVCLPRDGGTIVVDPGIVEVRKLILDPLAAAGISPEQVTDVVFSHHHPDHTLNAALFPNARAHDVVRHFALGTDLLVELARSTRSSSPCGAGGVRCGGPGPRPRARPSSARRSSGLYTATIDSDTFDACPPLVVRYAYGPPLLDVDRIEIRDIEATGPLPDAGDEQAPEAVPDPRPQQIAARQVTEAWRRITSWLEQHAPATHAALLPGVSMYEIAALEEALGVGVPVELRALWLLCAGGKDTPGAGVMPDYGWALMPLGTVATSYRWHGENQRKLGAGWGVEDAMVWKPSWIPFCSWSVTDTSYGLFVDAGTGKVGHWDDTSVRTVGDQTLSILLEGTADKLEYPQLAAGYVPGLIGGRLVWGPPLAADEAALWERYTG